MYSNTHVIESDKIERFSYTVRGLQIRKVSRININRWDCFRLREYTHTACNDFVSRAVHRVQPLTGNSKRSSVWRPPASAGILYSYRGFSSQIPRFVCTHLVVHSSLLLLVGKNTIPNLDGKINALVLDKYILHFLPLKVNSTVSNKSQSNSLGMFYELFIHKKFSLVSDLLNE